MDIRTLIRTLRAERYLLASESLADMASALLKLMSLPYDGDRPFSDYVRHMIGPARTLATIQRQIGGVLTPTARKELDRISSAIHLFLQERSDLVFYTAADDDGGTLLCASISDLTAQLQATLWSQPQPVLRAGGLQPDLKPPLLRGQDAAPLHLPCHRPSPPRVLSSGQCMPRPAQTGPPVKSVRNFSDSP